MIELPRAAVTAGEIAEAAEFFSFGTNDLTQTAFGFSRDDIGKFVGMYEERKLVPANPFVTIDMPGVGRLMPIAGEEGRAANPSPAPRDLRRARRRPRLGRVLPPDRARLRELLAVPGGDGAPRRRPSRRGRVGVRLEVAAADGPVTRVTRNPPRDAERAPRSVMRPDAPRDRFRGPPTSPRNTGGGDDRAIVSAPRPGWWLIVLGVVCGSLSAFLAAPFAVRAMPPIGWTHDHSAAGIPTRPHGYNGSSRRSGNRAATRRARRDRPGRRSRRPVSTATSLSPVYRPRRELEHPQPHQRRPQGAGAVSRGSAATTAATSRGPRAGPCTRSARRSTPTGSATRAAAPRGTASAPTARTTEVPPEPVEGRVPGTQLLLGAELQHHPGSHAFPVRHRLLREAACVTEGISLAVVADGERRRGRSPVWRSEPGVARRGM